VLALSCSDKSVVSAACLLNSFLAKYPEYKVHLDDQYHVYPDACNSVGEMIRAYDRMKEFFSGASFLPAFRRSDYFKAGDPVDEIVATAKKNFDPVIMGTHGHGDFEEMILGNTANGVIRKPSIPVLIARPV